MTSPSGDPGFSGSPYSPEAFEPSYPQPPRPAKFQSRKAIHLILFVVTLLTATRAGYLHYLPYVADWGRADRALVEAVTIWHGLWYSLAIIAILGAHEMGHYFACRRYNVDASLPYFLPLYLSTSLTYLQTGTLGAVIRIREAFPTRRVLFDIAIAGPIAGFLVLLPVLFAGLSMSKVVQIPSDPTGIVVWIGEPLLYKGARWLILGPLGPGQDVNWHPLVFAAWFGMLATAINLLPFGQLDGGHITYAALGRLSTPISIATVSTAVIFTFVAPSWILMTVIMVLMLLILGPRHPRVIYEYEPLGRVRQGLAVLALIMLIICFTPVPFSLMGQ